MAGYVPSENEMNEFETLLKIIERLREPDGCPWDREQTLASLKPCVIEEAAEVVCGINVYEKTGSSNNLVEELGDLMLQAVMLTQIAKEEGLFTMEDVLHGVNEKMVRRHPHVFGENAAANADEALSRWNEMKQKEKTGKELEKEYLPGAFEESIELIEKAKKRKANKN